MPLLSVLDGCIVFLQIISGGIIMMTDGHTLLSIIIDDWTVDKRYLAPSLPTKIHLI